MKHRSPADIRRRLRRYVELGLVAEWSEAGGAYRLTTVAGDVDVVDADDVWAYLQGMSAGAWITSGVVGRV